MGSLTQEMERLADEVRRGRENRRRHASGLREGEVKRQEAAARAAERRAREVTVLRDQVRDQLAEGRARLEAESSELRSGLREFKQTLQSGVASFRAEVQDDLAGARAAWSQLHGAAPLTEARNPTDPAKAQTQPANAGPGDDLTTISGIGPGIQERLNRAGVKTFESLADTSPEQLREILGELNRLAHADEWVQAARDRLDGRRA